MPRASKVIRLDQLPDLVPDGASVALGGAWFANHPMAAVRELIRTGRTDLHLISILASIDAELMFAAGSIDHLTFGMVTMDAFGLPPLFRKAVERGDVEITELTSISLQMALDAAGRNVPFLPFRGPANSDLVQRHPEYYASIDSPFGEGSTLVVKALAPDVAIVHALRCDEHGNAQFDGTYGQDPETVKAAKLVIVTCEELVPTSTIAADPHMTKVPGFLVNAVIEAPFGAHPCSHVPRYAVDAWEILEYQTVATRGGDDLAAYVDQIRSESESEYRDRVLCGNRGQVLGILAGNGEVLVGRS